MALAYVLGFFAMLVVSGWHPTPKRTPPAAPAAVHPPALCPALANRFPFKVLSISCGGGEGRDVPNGSFGLNRRVLRLDPAA